MELVNKLFPTEKFINVDKYFRTDSSYEKEPMASLALTRSALHKAEMEYNGKFGYTIGRIQHIYIMSITDIC